MGLDRSVTFASGQTPSYETLRSLLVEQGHSPQLRMIDGQLAFPDEQPAPGWQELRVSVAAGMITIRREGHALRFVIWGNSDPALVEAWNALVDACARLAS